MGVEFESVSYDVDERFPPQMPVEDVPLYLARMKSDAFPRDITEGEIVITADTVVVSQGEILGKPQSIAQAEAMLRRLSGAEHNVITGVALRSKHMQRSFSVATRVWFSELRAEEIEYYIEHFAPLDKAGAYGIQEWIGYVGVERIDGSFYNVMGLPVQRLYSELCSML